MTGLLYPNVTALAMAPFDKAAGSASALLGTIPVVGRAFERA